MIRTIRGEAAARIALRNAGASTADEIRANSTDWLGSSSRQIEAVQNGLAVQCWDRAQSTFTFYRDWAKRHDLPVRISGAADLEFFPPLRKEDLREWMPLIASEAKATHMMSTGGSTGRPFTIPMARTNAARASRNIAMGRHANGIELGDRRLLIWGHRHLMTQGWRGRVQSVSRRLRDYATHTYRASAYELSDSRLEQLWAIMGRFQPSVIIGYSSAVRRLCVYGSEKGYSARLKAAIMTSENIFDSDFELVKSVLSSRLVNEYGMAEFGPIAYSVGDERHLRPFWGSFHVSRSTDGQLCVTDLGRPAFPLIRYLTGDRVGVDVSQSEIPRLTGRDSDLIRLLLGDGNLQTVHGELFAHAMASLPIREFQVQHGDGHIRIVFSADERERDRLEQAVGENLRAAIPGVDLSAIQFSTMADALTTVAGKRPSIIQLQ